MQNFLHRQILRISKRPILCCNSFRKMSNKYLIRGSFNAYKKTSLLVLIIKSLYQKFDSCKSRYFIKKHLIEQLLQEPQSFNSQQKVCFSYDSCKSYYLLFLNKKFVQSKQSMHHQNNLKLLMASTNVLFSLNTIVIMVDTNIITITTAMTMTMTMTISMTISITMTIIPDFSILRYILINSPIPILKFIVALLMLNCLTALINILSVLNFLNILPSLRSIVKVLFFLNIDHLIHFID